MKQVTTLIHLIIFTKNKISILTLIFSISQHFHRDPVVRLLNFWQSLLVTLRTLSRMRNLMDLRALLYIIYRVTKFSSLKSDNIKIINLVWILSTLINK